MVSISVIIPCYNSFHLMGKCLDSLENQTYKDFEVVIVDDHSEDDSFENLINYRNNSKLNLKILRNEMNCGPGFSRNVGLNNTSSEWVAFCDSDDWYDYDFLEKMLRKVKHDNAELVMCDHNFVYRNGNMRQGKTMKYFREGSTKKEYLALSMSSLCRLLIKRDLFQGIKVPELYNGEDVALVPQILKKASIITFIDEPLYNYYIRNNSTSNTPSSKISESLITAFSIITDSIGELYPKECEYLGIKIVLYGATLNAFKANVKMTKVREFVNEFSSSYPQWHKNIYLNKLGWKKIAYIIFIRKKLFIVNKIYSKIHLWYTTK